MEPAGPSAGPFVQEGPVVAVALSPDGKRLATVGPDDRTLLWDTMTGKEIGQLPTHLLPPAVGPERHRRQRDSLKWLYHATFVDNESLLSWSNDPPPRPSERPARLPFVGACIWSTTTHRPLGRFNADSCFALAPDRRTLATQVGRTVVLWELATHRERATLDVEVEDANAIGFCDGGRAVAVAFPAWTVRLWDAGTGKPLRRYNLKLPGPIPAPHNGLLFSADGERLMPAGSWDGTLRRWDTCSGKEIAPLSVHPRLVHNVICSPDGLRLAAVGKDSAGKGEVILVAETATGKVFHRIPRPAAEAGISTLAFGPDGKTVATGATDGRAFLWAVP
jgi:WD40 repeat protein